MKLVVQIPCFNEEKTIASVIKSIPRRIKGIKKVVILVVDDGSTDNSTREAKRAGADYFLQNKKNLGLAITFNTAIKKSLELGADIIVNTDADDQYDQTEIRKLIEPIVKDECDMVIGDRQVSNLNHMSVSRKLGNIIGSFTIRLLTGSNINDASSGFRAFSREAAQSFNLFSNHTYTHETIIQAFNNKLTIKEIPITFKKRRFGDSKLIDGLWLHIKRSMSTIIRTILMYKSFKYLVIAGFVFILIGVLIGARFVYFFLNGEGRGHTQSLILSSMLMSLGVNSIFLGVIADLIGINRRLIENIKK